MARHRSIFCLFLCVFSAGCAKDVAEDKTIEGTINAVVQAESNAAVQARDAKNEKQNVKTEEAAAVAVATREVLKSEGRTNELTPTKIAFQKKTLDKAEDVAKETFKELAGNGVNTKAAAAAAADAEVASADGATAEVLGSSDAGLANQVKLNAEKASVAAAKAIADHPDDQSLATADAVKEIQKEDVSGKPDLKKASKGLLAKASGAVSDLPVLAEAGVKKGEEAIAGPYVLILGLPLVGVLAWGMKSYKDGNTPYMLRLKQIKQEFAENSGEDFAKKLERESEYIQLEPIS